MKHFEDAFENVKPRLTPQLLEFYENFRKTSGLEAV